MFEKIIADYDALYPNQIPFEQKQAWLIRFEGQLEDKLLTVYAVTPAPEYIAAEPYDEVYTYYLKLKCAERNEDLGLPGGLTRAAMWPAVEST